MQLVKGGFIDQHRLIKKISQGAYGELWIAEYLSCEVALKIFTRAKKISQIKKEAFAQYRLSKLDPPKARFFPRIEHLNLEHSPPYIRMELVRGKNLELFLKDNKYLDIKTRVELGIRILEALHIVHQNNFIHGDLAPANIIVTSDLDIKLIDIGYGKIIEEADLLVSSDKDLGVATTMYAAPERFKEGCTRSSDIYSFGKIFYKILTGDEPLAIKPLKRIDLRLDERWDRFLYKCLEDEPDKRFSGAGVCLEQLNLLYSDLTRGDLFEYLRPRRMKARMRGIRLDLTLRVLSTIGLYLLFWLPGAIANIVFLQDVRKMAKKTGSRIPGTSFLEIMLLIFFFIPFGIMIFFLTLYIIMALSIR